MTRIVEVLLPALVSEGLADRFRAVAREIDLRVVSFDGGGSCDRDPAKSEVLFRYFPNDRFSGRNFGASELRQLWAHAPHLKWIQTNSSGVDGLLFPELVDSDIVLTSGATVNSGPVAESVMALLLAVSKRIPEHVRHQQKREWTRYKKLELRGSTVAVVGYGHIGEEVGRLCAAFGMRVLAVRRNPGRGGAYAETVFGHDDLRHALAQADFVALTAAQVRGEPPLIGAAELASMKPTAWLVNVARGTMVDETALVDALREGVIAGAALDVFPKEPLPANSQLWDLPNVLVSPHNSASSPRQDERTIDLFVENFRRWVSGEPLLNVIDKTRGY